MKISTHPKFKLTVILMGLYMSMMVLVSCMDEVDPDPMGTCSSTQNANAIDLKVKYGPYLGSSFATESDKIPFSEFVYYIELFPEVIAETKGQAGFPGRAYALSCVAIYNFKNITRIAIELTEPFKEIPAGTDISTLFLNGRQEKLSDMENFEGLTQFLEFKFDFVPENNSQLKTKTILYLNDGTQKSFESTSPVFLTN
ncbi:hypothetical protein PBT90_10485 [Algoriphagus halophytocola]|uniref:DUF4843 domain-containing protein n=1 Tax=Algoriphagus halophytocola TaxID=2991499 RepID=A0ABY6ML22_9BACT|nr:MULTISPECIES: hypothetical protein [unclassified Algoriphagus]UZD23815.1 hypothetical protein OM944_04815 [Algoriphagus sp. TR-M5]WBL41182.1 hypothetical protein PBT90_10485 [Algoriphagus sp. TR-M9]